MRFAVVCVSILAAIGLFTYLNWGKDGCQGAKAITYKDLQSCLSKMKNYEDYVLLPNDAKAGQRVSFHSVGNECRVYVSIDTIIDNKEAKWIDYCLISNPRAYLDCMEQGDPETAECNSWFTR